MSKVNLYKIDERYHGSFIENCEDKLNICKTKIIEIKGEKIHIRFLKSEGDTDKDLGWNWILKELEEPEIKVKTQPKAILIIEFDDDIYAVTFGSAFFLVDKYCDKDFAFDFARRVRFNEIKTTTLLSPNTQRNKNISTYVNYEQLEFDSGESFAKLKVKLNLDNMPEFLGEIIEIGNSIKFEFKESTIENILHTLFFVKITLEKEEIYKIPVFKKLVDSEKVQYLNQKLYKSVNENIESISISELDIIGVTEIFNNHDTKFELWLGNKRSIIEDLSISELERFAREKEINLSEEILNIKVKSFYNGFTIRTDKIFDLIDYIDDDERCVLSKGSWYLFNDDYLGYLEDSISEIDTVYNSNYDFSKLIHDQFIEEKYLLEKDDEIYQGLEESKIKGKLKDKYYSERVFNILRENDGFSNFDRIITKYGGASIELMDLRKENTIFAVKIGNASSTLCYAVDQSISTLKMIKHNTYNHLNGVENIAIWLVLKREPLPLGENGSPDIGVLKMLMLKNKLDAWKKEVRLLGLTPQIYINYKR